MASTDAMVAEYGSTVGALKRYLAKSHFEGKHSRLQLRLLREGDVKELREDESLTPLLELQLVLLKHLAPDRERDKKFLLSCSSGDGEEVERNLRSLQHPDLDPTDTCGVNPLFLAAWVDYRPPAA